MKLYRQRYHRYRRLPPASQHPRGKQSFRAWRSIYPDSLMIAVFICILIIFCFLQTSGEFLHWFVIPVALCGILIGTDAVDWFRGRLHIFDPVGIIGLLGFHFFFLAPMFHVSWDLWMDEDIIPPSDWRIWIGRMAILNFLGLVVYRFCRHLVSRPSKNQPQQTIWQLNRQRFFPLACVALVISLILQLMVYQKFGGITSYIQAASQAAKGIEENQFQGMGIIFLVSESFPILSMVAFAAYAQYKKRLQTETILIISLIIFVGLQLFFGGLRGSRSNTIWALFWAVGIIHFWLRKITKQHIALGLAFLVFFMYFYGFFKGGGLEGVQTALEGQEARTSLEQELDRSWQGLILQDLGRSDVQAFLLYQLTRSDSDYQYAWGRTYFAALSILFPGSIWPNKPPSKSKEGTEAQFGVGSYHPEYWESSRVYGLAGETMLNFGPFMVPFSFIILGIIVGKVQRWLLTWEPTDARVILLPMLTNLCFVILVSDLDNDIFFLFKNSGFPTLLIWLSSHKQVKKRGGEGERGRRTRGGDAPEGERHSSTDVVGA